MPNINCANHNKKNMAIQIDNHMSQSSAQHAI